MAKGPKYIVKFRREREGKTDYKKRLALLKSRGPRFLVRISNKNVTCQVIEHDNKGDKVIAEATSQAIKKMGWKSSGTNIPATYLVAYLCAKKAIKAKAKKAVFDMGFKDVVAGTRPFAALKGAVDAGMEIPHDEKVLPNQDRLEGKHIDDKIKTQITDLKKKIDAI
jgi:large subunit ribosomal protein L18